MNTSNSSLIWKLRYFICYAGVAGAQRLDTLRRTAFDALFGMQAYLCASKEEWDLLGKTLVCKVNKRLLQAVDLFCEATGERRKLTGAEVFGVLDAGSLMLDAGLPEAGGQKPDTLLRSREANREQRTAEVSFVLECIGETLRFYAGQPVTQENLQECVDRIANAVREQGLPAKSAVPAGEPKVESFYERLLGEHEQLDDRLNKLEKFIGESPTFADLPSFDQELLKEQFVAMNAYSVTLSARINRLSQMAEGSRSGGAVEAPVESEAAFSNDGGDDAPGGGGPGRETQGLGAGPADSGEAARGVVAAEGPSFAVPATEGAAKAAEAETTDGTTSTDQSPETGPATIRATIPGTGGQKKPAVKKKK